MKIVIVGAGKVGESLCSDLSSEGNDIILIEKDMNVMDNVLSENDIMGIEGNGANLRILEEAGADECDIFIAVTPEDEINIIASVMAKKMGAKYTIARVRNIEYSDHFEFMEKSMGIDLMLNPELEAAREIERSLKYPSALNVECFFRGKVSMISLMVRENTIIDGVQLKDFSGLSKHTDKVLISLVERGEEAIIPKGDFRLQKDDTIYITGTPDDLFDFYRDVGEDNRKIKSTIIVGASRICFYLVPMLRKRGIHVKVIEVNEQKAYTLAEEFPDLEIIHGDGTDASFLKKERIHHFESVVSLTGIDEENILLSLLAKKMNVKKTVTKVDRVSLLDIIGLVGLQTIITPKKIVADIIIKIVRALMNSRGSNLENLYRLSGNKVEALEFNIKEGARIVDIPIKELDLKPDILLSYIYRDHKVIIPSGNDHLKVNDKVIVTTTRHYLDDIDDVLREE